MHVTLLTPHDVSRRLGLARSTLAKLRLRGGGPPYVKLGAAVRYPEDSLVGWIEERQRYTSTADASTRVLTGN